MSMKLYIDGDAFPNLLKPIILRAVDRLKLPAIVISNKKIFIGKSNNFTYIVVEAGADEADNRIVDLVTEGDLVITADIPLADRVITKNAHALNHHGELYTEENIKDYLSMRNLMHDLRDSGMITGGAKPFSQKEATRFANAFNRFLTKHGKR